MIIDAEVHILPIEWENELSNEPEIRRAFFEHNEFPNIADRCNIHSVVQMSMNRGIEKILLMGIPCFHNRHNEMFNNIILSEKEKYNDLIDIMLIYNIAEKTEWRNYCASIDFSLVKGIKVIGGWQGFSYTDSLLDEVYQFLIEKQLILMPHVNHPTQVFSKDTPQELFSLARRFPDLKICAPHMGGGLFLYEGYEPVKQILKNVYYITSVSATMYMVSYAMNICPDKIIFGTDYPFNHCHNQETQISFIKDNFSKEQQEALFYKNYQRFFGNE